MGVMSVPVRSVVHGPEEGDNKARVVDRKELLERQDRFRRPMPLDAGITGAAEGSESIDAESLYPTSATPDADYRHDRKQRLRP